MTEDDIRKEFMAQFLEAAEERLGSCGQLLLKTGDDEGVERVEMVRARAEILRELHAFKGEARMMGSEEIGGATEVAESYLKARSVPIATVERRLLGRAFEAIRKYVAFEAGKADRSPRAELNALLRLLARPPARDDANESAIDHDRTTRMRPSQAAEVTDAAATGEAASGGAAGRRDSVQLVLIDDSDIVREMVVSQLTTAGYPTRGVATLNELRTICDELRPQLILCDFHLADDVTGTDICHEMKSDVTTAGIPIVLFSGMEEDELAAAAESAGAAGYLPKPDDPADFIRRLDRMADRFVPFE